ncbi:MAG: sulfotransferase [Geminicoccaceae bacterium]
MSNFEDNYSSIDRMVHGLAMSNLEMQRSLSRIEDKIFHESYQGVTAENPIFITSLPRAGTTLLLEIFSESQEVATHTYRHMPFILCPQLWDCVSRPFRRQGQSKERAHGDGMLINYDSVEAFEEVLWLHCWPDHFVNDRIYPWIFNDDDEDHEFAAFLRNHMRKIIALAQTRGEESRPQRYVSKNNANIARLGWLQQAFSDGTILIPYRDPFAHIASLARQHANFLATHERSAFSLRYMESIGHLEFGQAMRPIDFGNWLNGATSLSPQTPDFWAAYWIAAFDGILRTAGRRAIVFSYDRLCTDPEKGLAALEMKTGLRQGSLKRSSERLHAPTTVEPLDICSHHLEAIGGVQARLDARALF